MRYRITDTVAVGIACTIFLAGVIAFIVHWQAYVFSRHPMEGYDEAMRILPRAYVSSGFIPYRDFGIQYPPGIFLISHLVPSLTSEQQNMVIYSVFPVLFFVGTILLYRFQVSRYRYMMGVSGFLLLLIPLLHNESIADALLSLLIITVALSVRFGNTKLLTRLLFLFSILVIHWRLDRMFSFLFIQCLLFMPFAGWYWYQRKKNESKTLLSIVVTQLCGLIVGLAILTVYFVSHGGLENAVDFLYRLPVQVVYDYRDLPLPPPLSFQGSFFFLPWFSLAIFLLYAINELIVSRSCTQSDRVLPQMFLFLAPFSGLPYALGRSDEVHIRPMLFFTGVSILLAYMLSSGKRSSVLAILLVLLAIQSVRFLPFFARIPYDVFAMDELLKQSLSDCKAKTETVRYRSLFTGRMTYEHYLTNNVTMYFLNTSVPPATRYIADDPGVQNSCFWGERVSKELDRSPKPMLALITDKRDTRYEENKTRDMKSCGKIEQYLTTHPYKILGSCVLYSATYEIRLYD